ncbi:MAG TPA: glycoside hydrolase family 38 C-terminal domain-containing protein [Micromonosporaceae bacterium]|jgi:alpha-mannosidase
MHDDSALVLARVRRFLSERITPAIHRAAIPLAVSAWEAPGEPVPFAEAVAEKFHPFAIGTPWGKPWGTVWFHVTGTVPPEWAEALAETWVAAGSAASARTRAEILVDLGFTGGQPGFQAEGLVWSPGGVLVKGLEPRNNHIPAGAAGDSIDLYVEAAANPEISGGWTFTPTSLGDPLTAGDAPIYALRRMDLVLRDEQVALLIAEITALSGMVDHLTPVSSIRGAEIARALENMVDAMDPWDVRGTVGAGRAALRDVLAKPANASAHRVTAVGHAHIDSAWLWPARETRRKVARTFANVLNLMDSDPEAAAEQFVFAASSAQHYAWIKQAYPELFARIQERVAQGRFVPVGGMWVESDTNLPGGEALVRQFVAGQSFFLREFGVQCREVWLPDSFGYTGALPQIATAAGADYLLTLKISWNDTNVFPHHTFRWEGIDGSRILTHMPPVNNYCSELSAVDLARAERNFAEKGRANSSLVPFGFGDGGGGPTREMVTAARVAGDLEGSPTVTMAAPIDFFRAAQAEYPDPPVWTGELYLEYHRGTYTSQARIKRGNRRSEHLLREAELWASQASVRTGWPYPYEELAEIWQMVLLNQFHDILPGSSIAWVYRVAEDQYASAELRLEQIIADALSALEQAAPGSSESVARANPGPFVRDGVPAGAVGISVSAVPATLERDGTDLVLANAFVRCTVDASGRVSSAVHLATGREAVPPGQHLAELQIFRDTPTAFDAWNVDVQYRLHQSVLDTPDSVEVDTSGTSPRVVVVHRVGGSRIEQRIALAPSAATVEVETVVDWHERQRLLKLAFPIDVQAERAASEIQFGHINRSILQNTSWDTARFETSAHRWMHVGESGFGVAVANDASYGHDVTRVARAGGGVFTLVRQSLLRAPLFPDPEADQGEHRFTSTLTLGADIADAVREGYRVNLPLRPCTGGAVEPLVAVDDPALVVETVKLAEDRSGDLVVRLYESLGGRVSAQLSLGFEADEVYETDLLERRLDEPRAWQSQTQRLQVRPFQLVTLRIRPAPRP